MAKDTTRTRLSKEQLQELLALGVARADISAFQEDGYSFEEIQDLCRQLAARTDAEKTSDAERQAKATKKAMRPENEHHPAKSVFSYPEGDQARPRPDLPCKMFWVGQPVQHDVNTAREIELMLQLQPGEYRCTKSDGSPLKVNVNVRRDENTGKIDQLEVWFPTKGTARHNHRSMVDYLTEILSQQTAQVA
jgi:hypothetical protein